MISVAAELAGMHPQTLRMYERRGLVHPQRTAKNTRRYSQRDVERLRRIQELTDLGLNLAGVERVLAMEQQLTPWPCRCSACRRLQEPPSCAAIEPRGAFAPLRAGARAARRRSCTLGRAGGGPTRRVAPARAPTEAQIPAARQGTTWT